MSKCLSGGERLAGFVMPGFIVLCLALIILPAGATNGNIKDDGANRRTTTTAVSWDTNPIVDNRAIVHGKDAPEEVELCNALDNCVLQWTTLGAANWVGQSLEAYDGEDAARSGGITHSQDSWLETMVSESGTLSFWWQVSSEEEHDSLGFYVDYVLVEQISGSMPWVRKSFHMYAGQMASWRYSKDGLVSSGSDCGWVDAVEFVPDDALTISPVSGFSSTGYQNGPFTPSSKAYTLTNTGGASLVWSVSGDGTGWVEYAPAGGSLAPDASVLLTVSLNAGAEALNAGLHPFDYAIANDGTGYSRTFQGVLTVIPIPGEIVIEDTIVPADDLDVPFGNVIPGLSRTEQIILHNTDAAHELVVEGLTLMRVPSGKSPSTTQPVLSVSADVPKTKADTTRPHRPGQLIVGFKPGLKHTVTNGFHASMNAKRVRSYTLISADVVELPADTNLDKAVAAYTALPGVAYAEPNYEVHALVTPNDPLFDELWGMNNTGQTGSPPDADINAPEAWEFSKGSHDVLVGVIDTGVDYTHEDLAANMWVNEAEYTGTAGVDDDGNGIVDDIHGARWTNGDGSVTSGDPMDGDGHGTHCSGTLGGVGNNGVGVAGVNWNVSIMALKFLDDSGSGYDTDAISALEYAVDKGAHLTNNSWGGGGYSQALADAINAAGMANQLFIAAAGNDIGNNNDVNPHYPATYPSDNIIAVAASGQNDYKSYLSNYGPTTVDLAAPGVWILSTVPGNGYDGTYSGTSMAAPHVSGVAALLLSLNPGAPYQEVKGWILDNVTPLPQWEGLVLTGGRLNAVEALSHSNPHFQLANAPELPFAIEPGGSVAFDVIYAPIAVGTHSGKVRISSNDMDESEVEVVLSGSASDSDPPVPHPADLNEDFLIVMSEAIAYLAGWQQGTNPIGYAIRAAYLWQNGEWYLYNGSLTPPTCWELAP
ncbi:MAG TPA: S8 family serine peptidase [Candidatus Hydrogenedentes bacterium]|nr:S8 family serine peptidase [Candidatus Hydrogenedentota bacterium]